MNDPYKNRNPEFVADFKRQMGRYRRKIAEEDARKVMYILQESYETKFEQVMQEPTKISDYLDELEKKYLVWQLSITQYNELLKTDYK